MDNFRRLHILIAEDDPDDGDIITSSFEKSDDFGRVDLVRNGQELLDFLEAGPLPDVILTDINMPVLDGIEALTAMCGNREWSQIPSFVYSTTINPVYEAKCMDIGTRGFLVKPLTMKEFNEIPNKIVEVLHQVEK